MSSKAEPPPHFTSFSIPGLIISFLNEANALVNKNSRVLSISLSNDSQFFSSKMLFTEADGLFIDVSIVFEEDTYTAIFSALKHPIRRKILRMLEMAPATYTEIMNALGIETGLLNTTWRV